MKAGEPERRAVARAFPSGGPSAPGGRFPPEAPAEGGRRRQNVGPRSSQAPPPHILRLRRELCCWPAAKRGRVMDDC